MSETNEPTHAPLADADENALRGLLTRAHEPPTMRPLARRAVLAKLKARQRELHPAPPVRTKSRRRLGAVAGTVAAAALLSLWFSTGHQPVMHDNAGAEPRIVALADGTRIVLDAGARIIERKADELELVKGRALIDLAHGQRYVLASGEHRLVGEGARVVLARSGDNTTAAVARGRLRASTPGGDTTLWAGQQTDVTGGAAPKTAAAPRLTYLTAWARDTLTARQQKDHEPVRRGNLEARIPDTNTSFPLPMRKLTVDVKVQDGVVRATFDHTFFNHHNRNLEGVYNFALPHDAAVSRLGMYVNGTLMEGGIVERGRGRNIYEDIVYRRRDPALLEWMSGNELKVRVFPLPGRTEKRILMSYTQVLERLYDTERLVIPIPELDQPVSEVAYRVFVDDGANYQLTSSSHALEVRTEGANRVATFEAKEHTIGRDLVVELRHDRPERTLVRQHVDGDARYVMARSQPELEASPSARAPQDWVVLFDASASRSPKVLAAQERMLEKLATELDVYDRFAVVAFDATQRVMAGGFHRVAEFDVADLTAFLEAEAQDSIGYTDFGAALTLSRQLFAGREEPAGRAKNILYLGDGVPTAGALSPAELRALVDGHTFVGVGIGDRADSPLLRDLAASTGGAFTLVSGGEELSWTAFDLIAELNTPRVGSLQARVVDAAGQPVEGDVHVTAQASQGEDITVLGKLPADSAPAAVLVEGKLRDGTPWSRRVPLEPPQGEHVTHDAAYLPRLWARRHIAALSREDVGATGGGPTEDGADQREAQRAVITKLGMEHFLVTPETSLLVLETEADYAKHKVVRPAAERWAKYEAPAKIDVVVEPLKQPAIPFGSVVLRRPLTTGRGFGRTVWETTGDVYTAAFAGRDWTLDGRIAGFGGQLGGEGRWFQQGFDSGIIDRRGDFFGPQTGKLMAFIAPTESPFQALEEDKTVWRRNQQGQRGKGDGKGFADEVSALAKFDVNGIPRTQTVVLDSLNGDGGYFMFNAMQDDLSALVPQLFADSIDVEREAVRRGVAGGAKGTISPEALELLEGAARQPATYRLSHGAELSVTAEGFAVRRKTAMGLSEALAFDGRRVVGTYPELGLQTVRDADGAVMAAHLQHVPFVVPTVKQLGDRYEVTREGDRTLRVVALGTTDASLVTLDERGRVVRWETRGMSVVVTWTADGVSLSVDGGPVVRLSRVDETPAPLSVDDESARTVVSLPLRDIASSQRQLDGEMAGSARWRGALVQLLAAQAAQGTAQWKLIDELVKAGLEPTAGELVLASRTVNGSAKSLLEGRKNDPVAAYLQAVLRFRRGEGADAFTDDASSRFFTGLRRLRRSQTSYGSFEDVYSRYAHLADTDLAPSTRLSALAHAAGYAGKDDHAQVVAAYDALATHREVQARADLAAAAWLRSRGQHEDAARRFERGIAAADADGIYPSAAGLRAARAATSDLDAFRSWMLARRDRLVKKGTPEALVAAATMLDAWGTPDDLELVMRVVRREPVPSAPLSASLARILSRRGFIADAERLVQAHLGSGPQAFAMQMLAAEIAESDGRHGQAAQYVKKAMDQRTEMPLSLLRQLYERRFQLHVAHARALSMPHIEEALAVAAAWRKEDPDNPRIDRVCFDALSARGDHESAFRHISSIIERHPGEGSTYAEVAEALVAQGRIAHAEPIIVRAAEVEPTNPNWLLRRADMLRSMGKPKREQEVLERIAEGKWQDRFAPQVRQAKARLAQ